MAVTFFMLTELHKIPLAKVTRTPMRAVIPAISSLLFGGTLLLVFGREASDQREVHTSNQGGPLGGPLHSTVMYPWRDPLQLQGRMGG